MPMWCEQIAGMNTLMSDCLNASIDPLNMIMYWDELVPGNVIKPDNLRKCAAFYYSFKEFGNALRTEAAWFPLAILRHSVIQTIVGGISTVWREILRHLFCARTSLISVGVVLRLETPRLMRCKLSNILADEAARKGVWGVKGASGMKPCICCKNIVMKSAGFRADGYLHEIDAEHKYFDSATNEDVWSIVDHLEGQFALLTKDACSLLQTAIGFTLLPTGVLADRSLRDHVLPITMNTFDSMRCLYSHGIASTELHMFLTAARSKTGLTFEQLHSYCSAKGM